MSEKDEDYSLSAIFEALLCTVAVPPNKKPHTSSPREGRDGFEVTEENGGSGSRRPTDSSSEGEVIGEEIGRFHATKVLGTGAFSVVRMGRHNITRRRVALKIMSKKRIVAMGAQQHVAREIWHTRLVSAHPHLAKLYDVIDTSTSTVLAMEFVMGGELLNYMNNHALPPDEARKFFQQIVSGLEFIHGKGVVHRDLKLENILLDASRTKVKIVDFGLSNMVSRDGELMVTNCGSPRHAAPEVISGRPYAGPPVDVWSSGVILYSMLVGQLPFQGDVDDDLYRRIQSGKFWVPPYLTYGMKALVEGMICVDVAKRLTIQQIKGMDWFKRDLPQYLRRTPEETEREERHTVDQAVVEEVLTLYDMHSVEPVKRHEVEDAANAEDLTVEVNAEGEKRLMKDLQLAYRLVLDGERAKQMHIKKKISKRTATRGKGKKKLTNLLLRGKFM